MRVIGGTHRGRRIEAPPGRGTRPTSDRVREAVFSRVEALLGADHAGETALDLFAGSGALGIEALSRGVARVTFVERQRDALAALKRNLRALGLESRATVLAADAMSVPRRTTLPDAPFTLLFVDPPYRINKSEVRGVIEALVHSGMLAEGALVVWEHASTQAPEWPDGLEDLGGRRYGDTTVTFAQLGEGGDR